MLTTTGRDVDTLKEVAIKLEHRNAVPSLLEEEIRIYERLQPQVGFPRVYWYGWQNTFQVMVFELLGPNLEDLLCYCGGQFSLKTTLMLLDQLLHRFQSLHAANFLHRDIKPENILLGTGARGNTVYVTDLGLAISRPKSSPTSNVAEPYQQQRMLREPCLIGTCRYASVNAHLGVCESSLLST